MGKQFFSCALGAESLGCAIASTAHITQRVTLKQALECIFQANAHFILCYKV